jgi:hypothetical protein
MPVPNPLNPICETCGAFTTFNQTLPSGAREYRCRRHKPNYVCNDSDRPVGRPAIGDRAMTRAEIDKRYRENNPEKYRETQRNKPKKSRKKKVK